MLFCRQRLNSADPSATLRMTKERHLTANRSIAMYILCVKTNIKGVDTSQNKKSSCLLCFYTTANSTGDASKTRRARIDPKGAYNDVCDRGQAQAQRRIAMYILCVKTNIKGVGTSQNKKSSCLLCLYTTANSTGDASKTRRARIDPKGAYNDVCDRGQTQAQRRIAK